MNINIKMGYKKDLGDSVIYVSTGKTEKGYRGKAVKRKKNKKDQEDVIGDMIGRIL